MGRKDHVVVAVISDLTTSQAADMQMQIYNARQKYAPSSHGKIGIGTREQVGGLLRGGLFRNRIGTK